MSDHAWAQEILATFVLGGLDSAESDRLSAHVNTCPECARALEELQMMDSSMTALFEKARPDARLDDRLLLRLRQASSRRMATWLPKARWMLPAAALFLLALVGSQVEGLIAGSPTPSPTTWFSSQLGESEAIPQSGFSLPQLAAKLEDGFTWGAKPTSPGVPPTPEDVLRVIKDGEPVAPAEVRLQENLEQARQLTESKQKADFGDRLSDKSIKESRSATSLPALDLYYKSPTSGLSGSTAALGIPEDLGLDREKLGALGYSAPAKALVVKGATRPPSTGKDLQDITRFYTNYGLQLGQPVATAPSQSAPQAAAIVAPTPAPPPEKMLKQLDSDKGGAPSAGASIDSLTRSRDGAVSGWREGKEAQALGDEQAGRRLVRFDESGKGKGTALEAPAAPQTPKLDSGPRKIIIRTGELEFEIDSFDSGVATIARLINALPGAFIATVNSEKLANGKVRGSVVVRVPPEKLDAFVLDLRKDLAKAGDLKSQRIGSQDITKQYTDLESRLRAARTMEERLLQIIKSGKGEIKDLLSAEKELGVWRTKIEEMEGELRYYGHQVALSTLTITLTEKEIRAPFGTLETEKIQMGVEVEDVEKAQAMALAVVSEFKGRITKSELKQMAAGQLQALVNCEIPADSAGPVRDRFKQLGLVARLEVNRLLEPEGGTGKPQDGRVTRKDAQFFLSLYNLAEMQPREVVQMDIAAADAEAAYQTVLGRVRAMGGKVASSNLNRQRNDQTTATVQLDVKTADAEALLTQIRALGEVLRYQLIENAAAQNTTRSKRGVTLQIVSLASVPPKETSVMQVAVRDVPASFKALQDEVASMKGRVLNAQLNDLDRNNVTAQLDFEIQREKEPGLLTFLKVAGDILGRTLTRMPENDLSVTSKIRLQITLLDAAKIPARDTVVLGIEVTNVDSTVNLFESFAKEAKGRVVESTVAHERNGKITANLVLDVPLASAPATVMKLRAAGTVRVQQASRNQQVPDGPLALARLQVTLSNADLIVPSDGGLWSHIRKGLTTSASALLWSINVVIIGLLFVLPWVLALYGCYRIAGWLKKKPA